MSASGQRTLRSKKLRAALWIAAGGKCAICGSDLDAGWHADHIEPWSSTKRTNVHEMQATCPRCNRKKGAGALKLRGHQKEARILAERLVRSMAESESLSEVTVTPGDGMGGRAIVACDITPGGGKTNMYELINSELLEAGVVSQTIVLVPNVNLGTQVERAMCKKDPLFNPRGFQAQFCRTNRAPLLKKPNRIVIATYQAVKQNPMLYVELARLHPTCLVCDEVGLLADDEGRAWSSAVKLVADACRVVLAVSGTMFRNGGDPIPFVRYEEGDDGKRYPCPDISYKLSQAIAERAVLPIEFKLVDAKVKYFSDGEDKEFDLSSPTSEEEGRKLATLLSDRDARNRIIDEAMSHWANWRTRKGARSRLIIVCADTDMAEDVRRYVQRKGHEVALAVSRNEDGLEELETFRDKGRPDVMVTVAMASIGLDVKDLTHMVYLNRARSLPWVIQAFARVTRFDPESGLEYGQQFGFIWAPNDPRMRRIVDWMENEQRIGLRERETDGGGGGDGGPDDFVPHAAEVTGVRTEAPNVSDVDAEELEEAEEVCARARVFGISAVEMARILRESRTTTPRRQPEPPADDDGPSVREKKKRSILHRLSSRLDASRGLDNGSTSRRIFKMYGDRHAMTEAQLDSAIKLISADLAGQAA